MFPGLSHRGKRGVSRVTTLPRTHKLSWFSAPIYLSKTYVPAKSLPRFSRVFTGLVPVQTSSSRLLLSPVSAPGCCGLHGRWDSVLWAKPPAFDSKPEESQVSHQLHSFESSQYWIYTLCPHGTETNAFSCLRVKPCGEAWKPECKAQWKDWQSWSSPLSSIPICC